MEKKFMTGDKVKITSKASRWKGAHGEVVGYCDGKYPTIVRVRISDKKVLTLFDEGLELISRSPLADDAAKKAFAKEELKKKVLNIMQEGTREDACECLAETVLDSVNTDNESLDKIGYFLLKAFLEDDVSDALIALCGWSLESLLIKAKILPDTQGLILGED